MSDQRIVIINGCSVNEQDQQEGKIMRVWTQKERKI